MISDYPSGVPNGSCGLAGTGVSCPVPFALGVAPVSGGSQTADAATDEGLPPVPNSDAEWRERLTPEQYDVMRRKGTEPAFGGRYRDCHEGATYHCAGGQRRSTRGPLRGPDARAVGQRRESPSPSPGVSGTR